MRLTISASLLILGVVLLLAGFLLSFRAGCSGDLKGGALGDPSEALRLQGLAALTALASAVSFVGAVTTLKSKSFGAKVSLAIAVTLATALVWVTVGWEMEVLGVKECFSTT